MRQSFILTLPLALAAMTLPAAAATFGEKSVAYSLGEGGTSLVKLAGPGVDFAGSKTLDFGGAAVTLDSITYRPKTKQLYGYDNAAGTVYLIDAMTGKADAVLSEPGLTSSDDLGFDFNNVLDAARIVTSQDENRVYFPNNTPPNFVSATDLAYEMGDDNEGSDPNVVANAYSNAVPNPGTTTQYVLDSGLDVLATLANNAGTLTTVGSLFFEGLAFDMTADAGFDILSFSEGDNTAFALLTNFAGMSQGVFEVPLFADAMGRINLSEVASYDGSFGTLTGLAVAPVPLPASLPLLAGGIALIGMIRRRKS